MYIEFCLPTGAGGMAASMSVNRIKFDIEVWAQKHSIQQYKTKIHKYTYRLILQNDQAYSHFALTWDPKWAESKNFIFKQPK
jgi:hypothetical protein